MNTKEQFKQQYLQVLRQVAQSQAEVTGRSQFVLDPKSDECFGLIGTREAAQGYFKQFPNSTAEGYYASGKIMSFEAYELEEIFTINA